MFLTVYFSSSTGVYCVCDSISLSYFKWLFSFYDTLFCIVANEVEAEVICPQEPGVFTILGIWILNPIVGSLNGNVSSILSKLEYLI